MVNRNISVRKNTDYLPHRPSVSFGGFCSFKRALHAYSFGVGPSVPPAKHKSRPMSTGTLEAFKCEPLSLLTVVLAPFFIAFFNFFLARLSTSHRNTWQQRTSVSGNGRLFCRGNHGILFSNCPSQKSNVVGSPSVSGWSTGSTQLHIVFLFRAG